MKIEVDFPTPKQLLTKRIRDTIAKDVRELQLLVGDEFFLEVVGGIFEDGHFHRKCTGATFRVPGSEFLITIDKYDLEDD